MSTSWAFHEPIRGASTCRIRRYLRAEASFGRASHAAFLDDAGVGERWTRHTTDQLDAAVRDVTYEARWLARGHAWSNELWSLNSDVANLLLEAALVHCRVLLYFLAPGAAKAGDVLACECLDDDPDLTPRSVVSDDRFEVIVGCTAQVAKDDGRVARSPRRLAAG